jgi:hypothetical protein
MKIKNGQISTIINFLDGMKLKGRQSLGRTKLKEKLTEKNEEVTADQVEIIDEFEGWSDKEKGQFVNTNKEMNEAINTLLLQESEVEYNSPFKKDFAEVLENYDGDLSGTDADMYAVLYEQLVEEK